MRHLQKENQVLLALIEDRVQGQTLEAKKADLGVIGLLHCRQDRVEQSHDTGVLRVLAGRLEDGLDDVQPGHLGARRDWLRIISVRLEQVGEDLEQNPAATETQRSKNAMVGRGGTSANNCTTYNSQSFSTG